MHFCLKHGSLHRGPPFAIKRITDWLKGFFKMAASIGGCHLQLKEQFSLSEPSAILEEPFVSYLMLETPPKQILNANWAKNYCRVDSESTLRCTLNMAPNRARSSRMGKTNFVRLKCSLLNQLIYDEYNWIIFSYRTRSNDTHSESLITTTFGLLLYHIVAHSDIFYHTLSLCVPSCVGPEMVTPK